MTLLPDEPIIDVVEVQGHIYPGFGAPHGVVIGFKLDDPGAAGAIRHALAALVPFVTPMAEALEARTARRQAALSGNPPPALRQAMLALALGVRATEALGLGRRGFDPFFREGMATDAGALGDAVDQDRHPIGWAAGATPDSAIDLLIVGGDSSADRLMAHAEEWTAAVAGAFTRTLLQPARRRPGDKEFFGFADGISNPEIRGKDGTGAALQPRTIDPTDARAAIFSRPGRRLLWPGAALFGLPTQSSDPLSPGPAVPAPHPTLTNGSYLVFRRLAQDVGAFEAALDRAITHLATIGIDLSRDQLTAMLVGRWPDGTPLHLSPNGPDPDISHDRNRVNNFGFAGGTDAMRHTTPQGPETLPATPGDILGRLMPLVSHIRQVNPRDGLSEIGREEHAKRLIFRRGITYGPEVSDDPDAERGLLFLCYQISIERQFRFLQQNWANSSQRPTSRGIDPIVGQSPTAPPQRTISIPVPGGGERACPFDGRWVKTTAGAYLVAPGISGLRQMAADSG